MGFIQPCGSCRRLASDTEAAEAFDAFVRRFPVPARAEHQCSPSCHGWSLVLRDGGALPGYEIQRCDDCARFENDDDALGGAIAWILDRLAEVAAAETGASAGGAPC
jgi:hypothetical protein